MRGTVTLAAALALPDGAGGAAAFPYRGLIVLTAFTVVLGTLVIQGFTLRPLLLLLGLGDDGLVERELRAGRAAMFKAALDSLGERQTEVAGRSVVNIRISWHGPTARMDSSRRRMKRGDGLARQRPSRGAGDANVAEGCR